MKTKHFSFTHSWALPVPAPPPSAKVTMYEMSSLLGSKSLSLSHPISSAAGLLWGLGLAVPDCVFVPVANC